MSRIPQSFVLLLTSSSRWPASQHTLTEPSLLASTLLVAVLKKPELLKKKLSVIKKRSMSPCLLETGSYNGARLVCKLMILLLLTGSQSVSFTI